MWQKNKTSVLAVLLLSTLLVPATSDEPPAAAQTAAATGEYRLADFGPVQTAAEAQATLETALEQIVARGGGVLIIGPGVAPDWVVENTAPSSTQRGAPTVTIMDMRRGYLSCLLPSNAGRREGSDWLGLQLSRTVRQPIDMAYGVHSSLGIDTAITGGTSSYLQRLDEDVKAGDDQRIYVPTARGLAVGNRLVLYDPNEEVVIKAIGWDQEKMAPYVVADVAHDHAASPSVYRFGLGNKHVVNSLTITDDVQSDNQSMTVKAARNQYADGDGFVYSAVIRSQANIMSSLGDEGALCYAADIFNDLNPFRSTVESWNPQTSELVYAPGVTRNFTLGASRPLINMNPEKHVTAGTVYVVAPGHRDPWDPNDPTQTGQGYEGEIFPGGAIIGLPECGWTEDVVGRFFALDEPTEYLDPENDPAAGYTAGPNMRVHRWYHIRKLEERADGSYRLYVERTRWNSSINNVPRLYQRSNYTDTLGSEPRLVPLRYIIAPGAYVADVSRAWSDSRHTGGRESAAAPRTLGLAASPDVGGPSDFAAGDPVVQAIGQDPWNPTGVRVRHHNYLPSTIEDSSFQAVNHGRVSVDSALSVSGGGRDLASASERRKDGGPAFRTGIDLTATTGIGMRFGADVTEAALRFDQPHGRPQSLVWLTSVPNRRSTLTVDPETGDFHLRGGTLRSSGLALAGGTGISAGETPARNLRGINVAVPAGASEVTVRFPRAEADADYALSVTPTWLTALAVASKQAESFTVIFDRPAPEAATFDWMIMR